MRHLCSKEELESILDLFVSLQPMKELKRQGAIYYGERMMEADTIAGHSFTVASLAWLIARTLRNRGHAIDVKKVLEMALCHDMGEAVTGDIGTVIKQFGQQGKARGSQKDGCESDSLDKLESRAFAMLVEQQVSPQELTALHTDYEKLQSLEAGIVKIADRLDAWVHALNTPSLRPLIQAWCYYNNQTYKKLRKKGKKQNDKDFWKALAELFRSACYGLIGRTAILLNQNEKTFHNRAWPWSGDIKNQRTVASGRPRGQRG